VVTRRFDPAKSKAMSLWYDGRTEHATGMSIFTTHKVFSLRKWFSLREWRILAADHSRGTLGSGRKLRGQASVSSAANATLLEAITRRSNLTEQKLKGDQTAFGRRLFRASPRLATGRRCEHPSKSRPQPKAEMGAPKDGQKVDHRPAETAAKRSTPTLRW
jgi:hypothetical protein